MPVGKSRCPKRAPIPKSGICNPKSNQALIEHGVGDFYEARDVGAGDKVAGTAVFFGGFTGAFVDVAHNGLELGVGFLEGPGDPLAVLRHFEAGDGDLIA